MIEQLSENGTESFRDQLRNPTPLKLYDVEIPVTHLKPKNPKEGVVFFGPGFSADTVTSENTLRALYDREREVITFGQPPDGGEDATVFTNDEKEILKGYPTSLWRKVGILIRVLENEKVEGLRAIVHSEAFPITALAAILRPKLFRSIVAYAPAGMIGKDTFPRFISGSLAQKGVQPDWGAEPTDESTLSPELLAQKRAAHARGIEEFAAPTKEEQDVINETVAREDKNLQKYILSAPLNSLVELFGLSEVRSEGLLMKLRLLDIDVAVMSASDDSVFPQDQMQATALREEFKQLGVYYVSLPGVHGSIAHRPIVAKLAEEVSRQLELRRKSKTTGTSV